MVTAGRCMSLEGQGLGLRGSGFDAESGLSEESAGEPGPVLDALEPVLHDGGQLPDVAGGEVARAVVRVRPDALNPIQPGA